MNKPRKSLGAISKQLQVPRSTEQTAVCKYKVHGTVLSLPRSERVRVKAAARKLIRMVKSQPKKKKEDEKQICNELEVGRRVSVSTVKCV